jgi:hypothetical protein
MPGNILGEPSNLKLAKNVGGTDTLYDEMGNVVYSTLSSEPVQTPPVKTVTVTPLIQNENTSQDNRVKIRVPSDYLTQLTAGSWRNELREFGGIIFPYTPQITLEHKAEYTSQNPTHSNYTLQFYKTSSVGEITITGKFTVQNDKDALVYLATTHLLSALTKMRWGGIGGDADSGAPPPVCRLDAYGTFMLKNVPVVISSFKHDLPDDVDFYTITSGPFGVASVPTKATFTVNCKPAYSRQEILSTSVTKYLNNPSTRLKGFL